MLQMKSLKEGRCMFDIIIKNGKVVDGTGNPWFKADLGIKNGKIAKIGRLDSFEAEKTLDAKGLVVCPGFIDIHNHSDLAVLLNPKLESAVRQGVTTLVIGNCGISPAPVHPSKKDLLLKYLSSLISPAEKLDVGWNTFGEYLITIEKNKTSANIAPMVGHGTVRMAVMGFEDRDPTPKELEEMKGLVAEAMEAGAFGMSTGLIYPPGVYSKTDELIELCKVVARYGGIYASHIRGEGATLIEAVREAIEIGDKASVPVEISHHKAAGKPNWGKTVETLKMMEEARAMGVDVTFDLYPYNAGMTSLATLLPPWAHVGGMEEMLKRLKNHEEREKMRDHIKHGIPGWENFVADCGWENIYISSVKSEKNKPFEGKNLSEIAKVKGEDEFDALCDLLLEEEGQATMVLFMMNEEDIRRIMRHPLSMFGSDSWSVAPYGALGVGKPHPRFYGTYPKILGEYVRENRVLRLEEAIRKMTSLPAQKIGLWDRGLIREGKWADIVIFDPDRVEDRATYQNPHQYPEGIENVLVNGQIVIDQGRHTGIMAGKILKHCK